MDATILIVEDEKNINEVLAFTFQKEGYKTLSAYDGTTGVEMALKEKPSLVLLDINLPGMDGMDACKEIRKTSNVPIIMLTAREDEVDKIVGLELGADDYITKPYSARELSARVKALLRRTEMVADSAAAVEDKNTITSGDVVINIDRYEVKKNGKTVDITLREFELLKFLAIAPDQIFSREVLLENVWGYEYLGDVRTVDVTIRRLREKIEDDPSMPRYIMTKRSIGYYFNKI
ncbi:MAG: response regulator transcription factor [Clostridia bacterium]|nr:response regulator transcription factor [Clostridia bacterium]